MFLRESLHLIVVDGAVGLQTVLKRLEELAGKIHLGAVGEVTALIQAHAEYGVAGVQQREVNRGIGLRPGVGLNVGVSRAKQLLGPLDRQGFGDVDELAAAVIALAGVTLGVLVGKHRTLGFENPRTGVVLRGNQLDMVFLTSSLRGDGLGKLGVETVNFHLRIEHRKLQG